MATTPSDESTPRKPLRLWPGVVAAVLLCAGAVRASPSSCPTGMALGMMGALARRGWRSSCGGCSSAGRPGPSAWAPRPDDRRAVRDLAPRPRVDRGAGMGIVALLLGDPVLSLALVAWAVASRRLSDGPRRAALVAAILLALRACGRSCGPMASRRRHRFRLPLAVDADSRGTAPGPGRRRADGAAAGAGRHPRPPKEPPLPPRPATRSPQRAVGPRARDSSDPRRSRSSRGRRPSGPASAGPGATASFAACGSRPTGRSRRRSRCGAGRSARAGRPSRSAATSSTRRSSAATTRSSPATRLTTGRAGVEAPRRGPVLGVECRRRPARRRRPSATAASTRSARPES